MTVNDSRTIDMSEPPVTCPTPNLRTRWTMFLVRLGIRVKRFKSLGDLYNDLES